jgi:serine/threonine protein kinase
MMPACAFHGIHVAGARSLSSLLRGVEPGFLDLLGGCLQWDPARRLSPQEALAHPWISGTSVMNVGAVLDQRFSMQAIVMVLTSSQ